MTPTQMILEFGARTALDPGSFHESACNAEARRWLSGDAAWPSHALVLHGPPRSGKSHLARIWAGRRGAGILQGTELAAADVPDLAAGDLVVEDADRTPVERELFHLFNLMREEGRLLLLTSRIRPADWPIRLPDLRSRIAAAPAVAIDEVDDGLLAPLLVKLAADRQMLLGPDVVQYLLKRQERTFAAAELVIDALDRAAVAGQRRVTPAFAGQVLARLDGEET
jgi:chromosomal replication initiation ATPase DnaA